MFSKKAAKIDTVDLTLCSKCQIDGEDFFIFCGILGKHELYSDTRIFWYSDTLILILKTFFFQNTSNLI